MSRNGTKFTDTEKKIVDVLSDGLRHHSIELQQLLPDQRAEGISKHGTVRVHIVNIRKVIRPRGEDILCEFYNQRKWYRWVRLLVRV